MPLSRTHCGDGLLFVSRQRMSNRVLNSHFPKAEASLQEEEDLAKEGLGLGEAWEQDSIDKAENGKQEQQQEMPSSSPGTLRILANAETWKQEEEKRD